MRFLRTPRDGLPSDLDHGTSTANSVPTSLPDKRPDAPTPRFQNLSRVFKSQCRPEPPLMPSSSLSSNGSQHKITYSCKESRSSRFSSDPSALNLDSLRKRLYSIRAKMGFPQRKPATGFSACSLPYDKTSSVQEIHTVTRLSAWDQASMRSYIRVVLCFPFDNDALPAATQHIEQSLQRLAAQRPDFAGTIEVHKGGIVHLRTISGSVRGQSSIPFSTVDISSEFQYDSFAAFKAAEFPPGAFVGPQFNQPCVTGEGFPAVPVAVVKAFVIRGGFFLGIYLNHAVADGDCLRVFIDAFAGQSRQAPVFSPSTVEHYVPLPKSIKISTDDSLQPLLARIPEYLLLDDPLGPTMPRLRAEGVPMNTIAKTGKIFVFNNERLNDLRCIVTRELAKAQKKMLESCENGANGAANGAANGVVNGSSAGTNYTCLAALAWAHIARARLADKNQYVPYNAAADGTALLQTMVNWKSRAFKDKNTNYFGNATAVAATQVPTKGLLTEATQSQAGLAGLVAAIEKTIASVNEEYVQDRTELFMRVSDPRRIGLRFDPRTPQDLGFNTWRFFGADTKWMIPGVEEGKVASPAVVRRMQDAWNMSGALILPAKTGSTTHELLVTLPQSSMDLLCADADWMLWVDHVIG